MAVTFDCARCGKFYEVPPSHAGKRGRCKQCGHINRIPLEAHENKVSAPALADTISFDCMFCGKHFDVSRQLAGKRARCKQCQNINRIPSPQTDEGRQPPPRLKPVEPAEDSPERAPREPKRSVSSRPRDATPMDHVFGDVDGDDQAPSLARPTRAHPTPQGKRQNDELEVAPLPARTFQPSTHEGRAGLDLPKPKKKRKIGFFAKSSKKRDGNRKGQRGGGGITIGGTLIFLLFLFRVAFNQGYIGGFGIVSRAGMERFCEDLLSGNEECVAALRTMHDPASARAAAPRLLVGLQKLVSVLRSGQGKKARKTVLLALEQKYKPRLLASSQAVTHEFERVMAIPGVSQELTGVIGPLSEIERLASGNKTGSPSQGFTPPPPPRFEHPIPRPGFPIPGPPNVGVDPMHEFPMRHRIGPGMR